MAAMFYFNSLPAESPRFPPKSRSTYWRPAKLSGKRPVARGMDFIHHACMARFDEPTFCSNVLPILLAQHYTPPSTPPARDFHDEPGELAFAPSTLDQQMANGDAILECEPEDGLSLRRASSTPTLSVHCASHPRPNDAEFWEEEGGRRVRFALDGDDNSGVPQFLPLPESDDVMVLEPSSSQDVHLPTLAVQSPQSEPHTEHATAITSISSASDWRTQHPTTALQYRIFTDEDWLPVDDPRRTYDVADFVDNWHLRSMTERSLAAFDHNRQPPHCLQQQDEIYREDVSDAAIDMQGISWPSLGTRRDDALAARALLHPMKRPYSHIGSTAIDASGYSCDAIEAPVYRFRNFVSRHRAQYSHYQLRNLVVAGSRSDVLYANGSKVYRTSLAAPSNRDVVLDVSKQSCTPEATFRITCLATPRCRDFPSYQSDEVLLAGGFNGEYAMLDLNSSAAHTEGYLTRAENGIATHIHTFNARRSGLLQAAFSSNDHRLRLLDTRTERFTNTFTYPYSVNCSATSPDTRLRVLVGDDNDVLITDAEKGDVLVQLKEHRDHGFACAWAPDGVHVATGAQDGTVAVWDARSWSRPLRSLPSTMTCPRSVHFTDDGTLVVAENEDIVSVYAASSFAKRQDIRFFGSVAGVAVLAGGAELVVANADKTVGGLMTFEQTAGGGSGYAGHAERLSRSQRRCRTAGSVLMSDDIPEVMV